MLALVAGVVVTTASGAWVDCKTTIPNGGTLTFAQNSPDNAKIVSGNGIECKGNATIKLTNPGGVKDGFLNPIVVATNGIVTIDATGCGYTNFNLRGGVVCCTTGKLRVVLDSDVKELTLGDTGSSASVGTAMPFDIPEIELVVGGAVVDEFPIVFRRHFTLIRPPTNYTWQIAKGSTISLGSPSQSYAKTFPRPSATVEPLAGYYDAKGVLDIGPEGLDCDLRLSATDAIAAGRTVRVGGRHTFTTYIVYFENWWARWGTNAGLKPRLNMPLAFGIHLDGADAKLELQDANCCYYDGDVWGDGQVVITGGGKTDSSYTFFRGRYAVTGPLTSTYDGYQRLVFSNPDGYLGDGKSYTGGLTLSMSNELEWAFADSGHAVALGGMTAKNQGLAVGCSAGSTLTLGDLEGCVRLLSSTNNVICEGATIAWWLSDTYYLKSSGDLDFSLIGSDPDRVLLTGDVILTKALPTTTYEVADGSHVALCEFTNLVHIANTPNSTVSVRDDGWREYLDPHIMLWLDASAANTYTNVFDSKKKAITAQYSDYEGREFTAASISYWRDCRGGGVGAFLNNIWASHNVDTNPYPNFYPHIVPTGLNGRDYMSFHGANNACRLHVLDFGGATSIQPKFAILVFGSQHGGGAGLFAEASSPHVFGRGKTLNDPIVSNRTDSLTFWLDGEKVADPTKTKFSGGWQIVSVQIDKVRIRGLGYSNTYTGAGADAGEQNYAEILFFDEVLEDEQRMNVERTLARKWGLGSTYKGGVGCARVNATGSGTIIAERETLITGDYEGTVKIGENGRLNLEELDPPPPGVEAVVAGRMLWLDPSREESVLTSVHEATGAQLVGQWYDSDGVSVDAAGRLRIETNTRVVYPWAVSRAPMLFPSARGKGEVMNWVDFGNVFGGQPLDDAANMLRFGIYPAHTNDQDVTKLEGVKTLFVVQDSSKGGGTPFLDDVSGSAIKPRHTKDDVSTKTLEQLAGMPIWSGSSAEKIRTSETYLNGLRVNGEKRGFNGAPELLTTMSPSGQTFDLGALDAYNPKTDTTKPEAGAVLGEIIAYNKYLSESERRNIEGYLMWKWFGGVRDGFAYLKNMSVEGSGSIRARSLADIPSLSADYKGDVTITGQTEAGFTISDGEVKNAFMSEGRLTMPKKCQVVLTVDSLAQDGAYTLIKVAGGLSGTTWTLDPVVRGKVGARIRRAELIPTDNEITVRLWLARGLVITFENRKND